MDSKEPMKNVEKAKREYCRLMKKYHGIDACVNYDCQIDCEKRTQHNAKLVADNKRIHGLWEIIASNEIECSITVSNGMQVTEYKPKYDSHKGFEKLEDEVLKHRIPKEGKCFVAVRPDDELIYVWVGTEEQLSELANEVITSESCDNDTHYFFDNGVEKRIKIAFG